MSKRILITGASGFVGANLARRVLQDGHQVHLLLRPGYQTWRVSGIAKDVRIHEVSLEDATGIHSSVTSIKPEAVYHLAAYGAYSSQQGMQRMVATNLLGCCSLLDACADIGVEAFVNAGSSSEYGFKDHAPQEDEALEPNSDYAITKAAASHYCRHVALSRNVNAVTVRLYSIYGPWEEPTRLIPTLIAHGLRGELPPLVSPDVARDFVYVNDAVDAIIRIAKSTVPRGSIYNICSGEQTSLREVVEVARRVMGIRAEPVWASMPDRSWDTSVWVGNGAKIKHDIGWRAETILETGLQRTVEWLCGNP